MNEMIHLQMDYTFYLHNEKFSMSYSLFLIVHVTLILG